MTDERDLPEAERVEETVQRPGEERQVVAGARLAGQTETWKIDCQDVGPSREGVEGTRPGFGETAEAVEEHDRGAAAPSHVVQGEAVDLPALEPDLWHGRRFYQTARDSMSAPSARRNGKTPKIPPVWMKQTRRPSARGSRRIVSSTP